MRTLKCTKAELNLAVVLLNGQSFRWRKCTVEGDDSEYFIGVAKHKVWKLWRVNDKKIGYEIIGRFSKASKNDLNDLKEYFQLGVDLSILYKQWKCADAYFESFVSSDEEFFNGIRILAQDSLETLFSFICSSNNNIQRISKMVAKLCEYYGESAKFTCNEACHEVFYDFANLDTMVSDDSMEQKLRDCGFGYRAAYLSSAALELKKLGGESWLTNLKNLPYSHVKRSLQVIPGIGPKVADCICLMGLQKHQVVPIDTHVIQITGNNYLSHLKDKKSLNKSTQIEIAQMWVEKFGDYAGWAHCVLFSAELIQFRNQSEMLKIRSQKVKSHRKRSAAKDSLKEASNSAKNSKRVRT